MQLINAAKYAMRALDLVQARAARRAPRSLMFLILIVTHRCNCKCRICDIWKTAEDQLDRELPTADWLRVIEQAAEINTLGISITGGEPLLRPDIFELLRCIRDRGMHSHLCSNGLLLTDETVDRLADVGLSSVSFSLDGPNPELHNFQRGVDCFDALIAGVERLRARAPRIRVGFNYVLNAHNFRHAGRAVEMARDLGAFSIRFAPIHTNLQHRAKPLDSFEDLRIEESQSEELRRELRGLADFLAKCPMHRNSRMFLEWIPASCRGRVPIECYAGYASCVIDPLGNVSPCPDIPSPLNVREMALPQIWRSRRFHQLRGEVSRCDTPCWDSTYGELALRFTLRSFLRDPVQVFRELAFYLGGKQA